MKTTVNLIRPARQEDLTELASLYQHARQFMAQTGNPHQWGNNQWPPQSLIEQDIELGRLYVITNEKGLLAAFVFEKGSHIDPCYDVIEGRWTTHEDQVYGVIHRLASNGKEGGIGHQVVEWASQQCSVIRIDTHPDNQVMQAMLKKEGFSYCGIIYVKQDSTGRLAFEKVL